MLGNLPGPTLIFIAALVIIAATICLIVWAIKRSARTRAQHQAELQRAYDAGLNQQQG